MRAHHPFGGQIAQKADWYRCHMSVRLSPVPSCCPSSGKMKERGLQKPKGAQQFLPNIQASDDNLSAGPAAINVA
jgi:hypothetical protein